MVAHYCVGVQFEFEAVFGFAKAAFEDFDHMLLSQVGNAATELDRYMHTVGARDGWPRRVRDISGLR